jgi:hypothetical protein
LVSLYVDEGRKRPIEEHGNDIKKIGDKWATFQFENFNEVAQPFYIILSPDQKLKNNPVGYTMKVITGNG